MGQSIQRIGNAGRDKIAGVALPVEAHHDFGVEVHPFAERDALRQLQHRGDRIHAKPAHAVFQLERKRFNPYPDVGYPATVQARTRNGIVIDRLPGDQRGWVFLRQFEQLRNILNGMLAVGVYLHRVGKSRV